MTTPRPCPRAGGGVHSWLLHAANLARRRGLPPQAAANDLRSSTAGCGRTVPPREIQDAVLKAYSSPGWRPRSLTHWTPPRSEWPTRDEKRITAIVEQGHGLADLWEAAPCRIEDNEVHTEQIIDRIFPGNPLLCCGQSQSVFATKPLDQWRGQLAGLQFIVPSPMTTPTGLTKDGRESAHALANTGPRRFLITEFDQGDVDQQAAILLHLAGYAPLVCACHSGGKSIHGWFFVAGQPEDKVRRFFRYAVALGADKALWTRSQFVRMPDGTRDNGKRQSVFFLNFRPMEATCQHS